MPRLGSKVHAPCGRGPCRVLYRGRVRPEASTVYRASHVLEDLGWVDLDFGSSPGWWAATVATYCPNRMVEHPKSKSTQPRFSTRCDTLYFSGLNPVGQPRRLGEGGA